MDPRLLRYYNQELQHLRDMGAEFAAEFPKIAARLRMDSTEVADPYVERLLEGFAFLTARLQLRMDAEFPRFTQRLLEILYPQFLAPVPSMLVAQLQPRLEDQSLAAGMKLPRGTVLRGRSAVSSTACDFTTGSDLVLWPVEVADADYFTHASELALPPALRRAAGGIRISLRCAPGMDLSGVQWENVRLCCTGQDAVAYKLHELVAGHTMAVVVRAAGRPDAPSETLPQDAVVAVGLDDCDALLPVTQRGFAGYRLLQEYFAFPQKFLFFDVQGAGAALRRLGGQQAEIVLLLSRGDPGLHQAVDAGSFALHCVPAINLFEHRCDRIHVSRDTHDFHVVPDRSHPMDLEVHSILEVTGFAAGSAAERRFMPLYAAVHEQEKLQPAYYTVQRQPRMLSAGQRRDGPRSSYVGTEVFLSIVDAQEAPYSDDLRQIGVRALCSNRDLPLHMNGSQGARELQLHASAPVDAVRVVRGPSRPQAAAREVDTAWKLINQFALHQTSLSDSGERQGAAALREMLRLYVAESDAGAQRQIEGLRTIHAKPTVRRLPMPGPIAFGRGVDIEVGIDSHAFEGASAFVLATILEQFFARHVSLNAFTVTRMRSDTQGVLFEGRPRCGSRPIM